MSCVFITANDQIQNTGARAVQLSSLGDGECASHPVRTSSASVGSVPLKSVNRSPTSETSPPGSRCVSQLGGSIPAEPRPTPTSVMHDSVPAAASSDGSVKMVAPVVANSIAGPAAHDQQMFDMRREAIRRQMAELSRQRQLAQAKVDELKRQQVGFAKGRKM
jgi:hypothetical protein